MALVQGEQPGRLGRAGDDHHRGVGQADPQLAVPALAPATRDANLDVRRAAVRSLAGWAYRAEVTELLRSVSADPDADVRAYARRALTAGSSGTQGAPEGTDSGDAEVVVASY